jgi:hypothetical protein
MATVRFSEELRERIRNNAQRMHEANIEKAEEAAPNNWGDRIYDRMFRNTRVGMNLLPEGYLDTRQAFTFGGFGEEGRTLWVEMEMSSEKRWPGNLPAGPDTGVTGGGGSRYNRIILEPTDERWYDLHAEYNLYCANVAAAQKQQTDFVDGVNSVLANYSTLAPALKAWPALWDLIPEDKKDRHREVVEKRGRSAPVTEAGELTDLNKLTAAVTANKLRGGS